MDLGPALFPVEPELGVMSRRAPSLVWERLRVPSLVWERLRLPSRDVVLEPEAVRDRIRRVMLAEGTGERRESHYGWKNARGSRTPAAVRPLRPAWTSVFASHPASQRSSRWAPRHPYIISQIQNSEAPMG